mgnify:CR=1 FL=1
MALAVLPGCEEQSPVRDLCVAENPQFCKPCTSDSDCIIGGNPCCNADHRWYCYHGGIEGLTFCDASCDFIPPKPGDANCRCIGGQCHGPNGESVAAEATTDAHAVTPDDAP